MSCQGEEIIGQVPCRTGCVSNILTQPVQSSFNSPRFIVINIGTFVNNTNNKFIYLLRVYSWRWRYQGPSYATLLLLRTAGAPGKGRCSFFSLLWIRNSDPAWIWPEIENFQIYFSSIFSFFSKFIRDCYCKIFGRGFPLKGSVPQCCFFYGVNWFRDSPS